MSILTLKNKEKKLKAYLEKKFFCGISTQSVFGALPGLVLSVAGLNKVGVLARHEHKRITLVGRTRALENEK